MDYLDKVLSSVNNNVEEALKELEEVNKVAQNEDLKHICEKLKDIISKINGLETAIDFNESML